MREKERESERERERERERCKKHIINVWSGEREQNKRMNVHKAVK